MLHQNYLFNPDGADLRLQAAGKLVLPPWLTRPRMIVPRGLCTFHRIRCTGVPQFKLRNFARLQAQALSPFVSHGCAAVRQGSWLHLWIWDSALESDFALKHRISDQFSVLPQSLYGHPLTNGVSPNAHTGIKGVEFLLWKDKRLQDSLWFPLAPSQEEWSALLVNAPELAGLGWPQTLPSVSNARQTPATHPWARNLVPRAGGQRQLNWSMLAPVVLSVASLGLTGWSAALLTQKFSYERAIVSLTQSQEQRLAELEPVQQARQQAQHITNWVKAAQALVPAQTTNALIGDLAPLITRQGLAIREMDINPPTVQVTLTAPGGGSPRLTSVLGALENKPYIYDARFVDVTGVSGFRFSWRLREQPASGSTQEATP